MPSYSLFYTFPYTTLFRSKCNIYFRSLSGVRSGGRDRNWVICLFQSILPVQKLCLGSFLCGRKILCFTDRGEYKERIPHFFMCRSEEHTSELQSLRHLVCRLIRCFTLFPTRRSSDLSVIFILDLCPEFVRGVGTGTG